MSEIAASLVSVIAVVDEKTVGSTRSILESFHRQTWPYRELIFVNLLDQDLGEVAQVRPGTGENPIDAGVRAAIGKICVVWTPGWWYHQDVLKIHSKLTSSWLTVELRHDL